MVHQGQSIGLIEVLDHQRERKFSRQEMRLANAVAGQAAVALYNARVFARLKRSDRDVLELRRAIDTITAGYETLHRQTTRTAILQTAAEVSAQSLGAISCVASCGGESAGASGLRPAGGSARSTAAHVIATSVQCGEEDLALTVTLGAAAGDGQTELLGLIAAMAAGAFAGCTG
jgi:GAF domain-containing protein